jgi:hypothetical protein
MFLHLQKCGFSIRTSRHRTPFALRTAAEKRKLMIALPHTRELPWLEQNRIPAEAKVSRTCLIDNNAKGSVSDTGELRRNWEQGILTINTPCSQAAIGRIGGKSIDLADVNIALSTQNATVAVQSLDDRSINEAGAILVSLGARSIPEAADETPLLLGTCRRATDDPRKESPQIALNRNLGTYWLLLK